MTRTALQHVRTSIRRGLAVALVASLLVVVDAVEPPTAAATPSGPGADRTFVVQPGPDAVDDDPGDGLCRASSGICTLRAAFDEAAALGGVTDVDLRSTGSGVSLQIPGDGGNDVGDLEVPAGVTIRLLGQSTSPTTTTEIVAVHDHRLVHVRPGGELRSVMVGFAEGDVDGDGGAILNEGVVHVESATTPFDAYPAFRGNRATGDGGAVANRSGATFILENRSQGSTSGSRVDLSDNRAGGDGGGIANDGTVELRGTRDLAAQDVYLDNNVADGVGGGIVNREDAVVDQGCRSFVRFSRATRGGNVFNEGRLTIRSEGGLDGGLADEEGGSLYNGDTGEVSLSTAAGCTSNVVQVARSSATEGGGFHNLGRLHVEAPMSLVVRGDGAPPSGYGAGGSVRGGELVVDGMLTMSDVTAEDDGGGLFLKRGLIDARNGHIIVRDAAAGGWGGGISAVEGTLLGRVWVRDATAARSGGAMYAAGDGTEVSLTHSSLIRSTAGGTGGGVDVEGAAFRAENTTIAGNDAVGGGGLHVRLSGPPIVLRHVTVADNAPNGVDVQQRELRLERTLFARNDTGCVGAAPVTGDFNVFDEPSCGPVGTDLTDAGRFPLVASRLDSDVTDGTNEWAVVLRSGNPAVDFVDDAGCGDPSDDQAFAVRPQDGDLDGVLACDAGAIEIEGRATRRVSGTVYDERSAGARFPGVCVALVDLDTFELEFALTGPDGGWMAEVPSPGRYLTLFWLNDPPATRSSNCSSMSIDRTVQAEWWRNVAVAFDGNGAPQLPDPASVNLVEVGDADVTGIDACLGTGPGAGADAPCPAGGPGGPGGPASPQGPGDPGNEPPLGGGPDRSGDLGARPGRPLAFAG